MKWKRTAWMSVLMSLIVMPAVFALDLPFQWNSFIDFLGGIGTTIQRLLSITEVVYGFAVIFMFLIMYGILGAALGKVNIFKGAKGGVNKSGKLVAVGMSLLITIAIFVFSDPRKVLESILKPMGILGGLLLAMVTFLIVYKGFESESGERSWKLGLAAAGFAMILAGMITAHSNIMWWGWLICLIGLIGFLFGAFGGAGAGGRGTAPGRKPGKKPGTGGVEPEPGEKPGEPTEVSATALPYRPTQFKIMDINDRPIKGAKITLTPKPKKAGIKTKLGKLQDHTGPTGESSALRLAADIPYNVKIKVDNPFKKLSRTAITSAILAGGLAAPVLGVGAAGIAAVKAGEAVGTAVGAEALKVASTLSGYLKSKVLWGAVPFLWNYRTGMPNASSEVVVQQGEGAEYIEIRVGDALKSKEIELLANPPKVPANDQSTSMITARLRIEETSLWRKGRYVQDTKKSKVKFIGKYVEIRTDFGTLVPMEGFEARPPEGGYDATKGWWRNWYKLSVLRGKHLPGFEPGPDSGHAFRSIPNEEGDVLVRIKSDEVGKATITAQVEGTIKADPIEVEFVEAPVLKIDAPDTVPVGTKMRAHLFLSKDYKIDRTEK